MKQKRASGKSWRQFITGEESMLFNRRDWRELTGSLKWFFNRGPRPEYGRWTYWEKFDYFAVFWGVAVIGGTGLLLWFPEIFTRLVPGWAVNVATTIHSDEALLAVSFIFVVHFFNTHFRPERFPMDTVIFTEGMPLEEFQRDRPREYRELVESGQLAQRMMPAPAPRDVTFWRRLGFHRSDHRPDPDWADCLRHALRLSVREHRLPWPATGKQMRVSVAAIPLQSWLGSRAARVSKRLSGSHCQSPRLSRRRHRSRLRPAQSVVQGLCRPRQRSLIRHRHRQHANAVVIR